MNSNRPILLVEDNPSDADLTRRALAKGHISNELVVAEDGQEALDYLRGEGAYTGRAISETPSVILLDLKLPKVSGLEVLRLIRADPPAPPSTGRHPYLIERGGGRGRGIRPRRQQLRAKARRFQGVSSRHRKSRLVLADSQRTESSGEIEFADEAQKDCSVDE